MRVLGLFLLSALVVFGSAFGQEARRAAKVKPENREVRLHSQGLHGYIGYGKERLPEGSKFSAGMGFYAAVWPLISKPFANFQIGLPGCWILPDNHNHHNLHRCYMLHQSKLDNQLDCLSILRLAFQMRHCQNRYQIHHYNLSLCQVHMYIRLVE